MWRLVAGVIFNSCGYKHRSPLNVSGLYFWFLLEKGRIMGATQRIVNRVGSAVSTTGRWLWGHKGNIITPASWIVVGLLIGIPFRIMSEEDVAKVIRQAVTK